MHGESRDRHDGGRTALNIVGLPSGDLHRGDVLTADGRIRGTDRLLVQLTLPGPASRGPLNARARSRASLRLHIGTDQVDAAIRDVPGGAGAVGLLTLSRPIATFAGDRGVLREPATGAIVAGVRVLDPAPPRGTSRRRLTPTRLERLSAAVTRILGTA